MDYDYKKKRLGKIPDEEVKQAVEKFEESKELAERSMFNFLENDVSLSFVFVYSGISRWEMHVGLDEACLILYRRQGLKAENVPFSLSWTGTSCTAAHGRTQEFSRSDKADTEVSCVFIIYEQ